MKGRKPTPTILKRLQGNPGKRPLPANEPQPTLEDELPPPPDWLVSRPDIRVERRGRYWMGIWREGGAERKERLYVDGVKGPRLARTRLEAEEAVEELAARLGGTGEAAEVWERVGGELHRLGLLTRVDYDAFAVFCQAVADYRWAQRVLARSRRFLRTPKGSVIEHPAAHVQRRAAEQIRQFGSEFGLTPAARARVVAGRVEADDPFERFLQKGLKRA